MNKDVIYIDVEDDITAIIGKVKSSNEKIVALVPPKRVGLLQSAVNLRLLARAASQTDKRLVLISSNSALMALASAAKIPVAKNLQSKPELAEIPLLDIDDGDDIIDGAQLPIGEHAKMGSVAATATATDPAIEAALRENAAEPSRALPPLPGQPLRKPKPKSGIGVPNFSKFRKRLALIIIGVLLLIAFLIWAFFFAAHATILITARTTDNSVNPKVTIGSELTTDLSKNTLKATMQQTKKDLAVDFTATGKKDVGDTAKGQVVFQNCESFSAKSIPSGTAVSANGLNYITQQDSSVPGAKGDLGVCAAPGKSTPVSVVAQAIGDPYNTPAGTQFSVAGHANSSSSFYFNAVASTDIAGGTKKQVTVVTAADVQKASDQLSQQNSDSVKALLTSKFGSTVVAIDQTFKIDKGQIVSTPAVDAEAPNDSAKLTSTVTYSILGVEKSEASTFLDAYLAKQLNGKTSQRVYNNGSSKVAFSDISAAQADYAATLIATAQIGPKIDDTAIKNQAVGKRYGEIQSSIEGIQGVDNVDVKFSPFWVSSAPSDTKRISVEFKLNGSK
jgi:hypothetical protein